MKISKKNLQYLIESLLNEDQRGDEQEQRAKDFSEQSKNVSMEEQIKKAEELFDLTLTDIQSMLTDPNPQLVFDGNFLYWSSGSGRELYKWPAKSGDKPLFNEPPEELMSEKGKGPTPEGQYELGFPEVKAKGWKNWLNGMRFKIKDAASKTMDPKHKDQQWYWNLDTQRSQDAFGNYRFYLYPTTKEQVTFYNKMTGEAYERDDMYIHGGNVYSSAGCIDLAGNMDQFAMLMSAWMYYNSQDEMGNVVQSPIISVNVDYPDDFESIDFNEQIPDLNRTR